MQGSKVTASTPTYKVQAIFFITLRTHFDPRVQRHTVELLTSILVASKYDGMTGDVLGYDDTHNTSWCVHSGITLIGTPFLFILNNGSIMNSLPCTLHNQE